MLTLADAKAQLNIETSNTDLDAELQGYVDAVEAVVSEQTSEIITPQDVTETHVARGQSTLALDAIPIIDVTSVARADGSYTWSVDDLYVIKDMGLITSQAVAFSGRIVVTVHAGYEQIPPNYRLGALVILQHLWKLQRGPSTAAFGAGPSYADGMSGFAVPRRAAELLGTMIGGVA